MTDKSQESELKNLNSFQVILSTDGARSFMLLHYDMRNWTDADALVIKLLFGNKKYARLFRDHSMVLLIYSH